MKTFPRDYRVLKHLLRQRYSFNAANLMPTLLSGSNQLLWTS
jgi:hypothetical protein